MTDNRVEGIRGLCEIIKQACLDKKEHPELRYGQALYNALYDVQPDLADKIRATENDPFYCTDDNDPKIHAFCEFVVDNWP